MNESAAWSPVHAAIAYPAPSILSSACTPGLLSPRSCSAPGIFGDLIEPLAVIAARAIRVAFIIHHRTGLLTGNGCKILDGWWVERRMPALDRGAAFFGARIFGFRIDCAKRPRMIGSYAFYRIFV